MKPGIIYGGVFLFAFVVVTGLLIYMNSTYENIFQFNFAPKSLAVADSLKTDSLKTSLKDSTAVKDSVLLSSIDGKKEPDSLDQNVSQNPGTVNPETKKTQDVVDQKNPKDKTSEQPTGNTNPTQGNLQGKEYTDWITKVTSIYSAMEPKKAAKIIQTYSDNVARDILYNMSKKTAAKVVSELSPETANRIFRFE